MERRLVDIVNKQLSKDCDCMVLFVTFSPNDNTLFGFGLYKNSNDQKHLDENISIDEIEDSNLKKWMMLSTGYGIQINILESNSTVTATAYFDQKDIFTFTASTLEDAMEGLKREMEGFNFEELHNELISSIPTWDETLQKTQLYRAKTKK